MNARRRQPGRRRLVLPILSLLCGCASSAQNDQLEAAVVRFEAAAARAEAAAAAADASAQQAAAAAARIAPRFPAGPFPPYLQLHGSQAYRRCSAAGRAPVQNTAQAVRLTQQFLRCMGLRWGKPTHTGADGQGSEYSVDYGVEPGFTDWTRRLFVDGRDGRVEFSLPR